MMMQSAQDLGWRVATGTRTALHGEIVNLRTKFSFDIQCAVTDDQLKRQQQEFLLYPCGRRFWFGCGVVAMTVRSTLPLLRPSPSWSTAIAGSMAAASNVVAKISFFRGLPLHLRHRASVPVDGHHRYPQI
jgi:hypothetical protein